MPRKRKATVLKLASGTFKTSDAPKHEPKYQPPEDITPPRTLNEQGPGARKWRELAPDLAAKGCLTKVDTQNLEIYCMAYEMSLMAKKEIDESDGVIVKTDKGGTVQNPAITTFATNANIMAKYSTMLGLDPSSRTKIEGKPPGGKGKSFSDLKK